MLTFIEPKFSLYCSQTPIIGPCHGPVQFTFSQTVSPRSILILSSKWPFPLKFSNQNIIYIYLSHAYEFVIRNSYYLTAMFIQKRNWILMAHVNHDHSGPLCINTRQKLGFECSNTEVAGSNSARNMYVHKSRRSSVGTATGYRLDDRDSEV
jgi:hypothetical protein